MTPDPERVEVTEADLDAALKCAWSPNTCLVAKALERHFEAEAMNCDHLTALIQKGATTYTYELIGVTRLMRNFDRAYPTPNNAEMDWKRIAQVRASLPVLFLVKLVDELDEAEEEEVTA